MSLVDTFPDAEAIVGTVIRDGVLARCYSSIPKTPTFPLVIVKRIGGIPVERHRLDRARIQIEVWGDARTTGASKGDIRDIAADIRTALFEAEGSTVDDGYITGVEDDLGLSWQPDQATARDRYVFGLAVYIHSAGGS